MSNDINLNTAILASGCFWCTEAVFTNLKGVNGVTSGYTGGHIKNPAYREICSGRTGHAEAVKITFNSSEVSYHDLLEVFFATHDPTTLNRQGNDIGTQYRSAIFYCDHEQRITAENYISQLDKKQVFENNIVTEVVPFEIFYNAENYHQDYYDNNKQQPYCQFVISPKLNTIKKYFKDKLKH